MTSGGAASLGIAAVGVLAGFVWTIAHRRTSSPASTADEWLVTPDEARDQADRRRYEMLRRVAAADYHRRTRKDPP
jgi:hypothetical protein